MSDQYLLPCTCGQPVRVGRAQAGQDVACVCGRQLSVPTLRGLRDLEPAPPADATRSPVAWGPVRGAIFSGGMLIAVSAILFSAYQLWSYTIVSKLTTDHTQTVIAYEEDQIDQMTAADMFDLWHEVKEQGIGPKMVPLWIAAEERAGSLSRQAMIGTVIGVLGALASLGAVFVGRKR